MRKEAEQEYAISAFDYVKNPIGSNEWCLFWKGFQAARNILWHTKNKSVTAHLSHNHNGDTLIVLSTGQTLLLKDLPGYSEALEVDKKHANRYRWLRDKSEPGICAFYLSVGKAFDGVKFNQETVDLAIDAQIAEKGK